MKDLLKMRRKGENIGGDVEIKMHQLKEENERLRAMALSVTEVEKLKQENKEMRLHL